MSEILFLISAKKIYSILFCSQYFLDSNSILYEQIGFGYSFIIFSAFNQIFSPIIFISKLNSSFNSLFIHLKILSFSSSHHPGKTQIFFPLC
jgi:hypothetical protein